MTDELLELLHRGLHPAGLQALLPIWREGVVLQLTNTPADIHIERWIRQTFPGLVRAQNAALSTTLKDYRKVLNAEVRQWTPPTVYRASVAMNYVFAKAIAELLDDRRLLRPYRDRPEVEIGGKLYELLEAIGNKGHDGDSITIDYWARELNLTGWYGWAKLGEVPDSSYS